jgi:regulator of sigma E protease
MFTFIVFLLVISLLVLVHEFGHFFAAKKSGMKVEEFGIGFPPRLVSVKRGGTLYSFNLIPFGGFVRIFGEDGEHRNAPGSFGHGTFWQKMAVVVGGVFMNVVLAAVLLMLGNFLGLRVGLFDAADAARAQDVRIQILQVAPQSPAEASGLRALDQIVGFREGGRILTVDSPEAVQAYANGHAGTAVMMVVRRGADDVDVPLTLRQAAPGQGPIGISLAMTGTIRYPWYESIWRGVANAGILFWATLVGYWQLLSGIFVDGRMASEVSGPIGIATLTGQAARVGFNYLIQFVAMISVNLAVLNILPFPALDGGRAVLVAAEKLRGKALSEQVERTINAAGFIVLIALMIAVTVKDLIRVF